LLELIRPPFFCPFRGCKPEPPKFPDVRVEKAPIFTDIWICELAEWHTADTILQICKNSELLRNILSKSISGRNGFQFTGGNSNSIMNPWEEKTGQLW
jgi:hypothetical protein